MGYRITTVARLTGIPRNTLLAWERRYALVEPGRSDNGYRDYSEADVEYLRRVKHLVDSGHKISEAISLLAESSRGGASTARADGNPDLGAIQNDLLDALLAFERPRAEAVLRRVDLLGYERRVCELFVPLLKEVGDRWHAGQVSIGQEHFATSFLRERLLAILVGLGFGPPHGPRVVCACIAGERHDGGLLGVAVRLALRGFRVLWLGSDLPAEEVVGALGHGPVRLVCLSAVTRRSAEQVVDFVDVVAKALPQGGRIAVGGAAIQPDALPDLPRVEWVGEVDRFLDSLHLAADA